MDLLSVILLLSGVLFHGQVLCDSYWTTVAREKLQVNMTSQTRFITSKPPELAYKVLSQIKLHGNNRNLAHSQVETIVVNVSCLRTNVDSLSFPGYSKQLAELDLWITGHCNDHISYRISPLPMTNGQNKTDLHSLHLSNIMFDGINQVTNLFSQVSNLQVLDLKGPFWLNADAWRNVHVNTIDFLMAVTNAMEGIQTLEILSFERFQGYGLSGNGVLNTTKLLDPLRNSQLKYLALKNLDLTVLTSGLYQAAPHLKALDLSQNDIFVHTENAAFFLELLWHPAMEIFWLEGTKSSTPVNSVNNNNVADTKTKSKRDAKNSLSFCLRKYNLTLSELFQPHFNLCPVWYCLAYESPLQYLVENIPCQVFDVGNWLQRGLRYDSKCENEFFLPIGGNLSDIILKDVHIPFQIAAKGEQFKYNYKAECLIRNKLRKIHFTTSPNFLHNFHYDPNRGVIGFDNVEELTFSNNFYKNLKLSSILSSFTNVKVLSLSGNEFSETDFNTVNLCAVSKQVRSVDFSSMSIKHVSDVLFDNCSHLGSINLANNQIKNLDFTFNSPVLQLINVSGNPIVNISHKFMKTVDVHSEILMKSSENIPLHIDLSNIHFLCACSHIDILEWIKGHEDKKRVKFIGYDEYMCRHEGTEESLRDFNVKKLDCSTVKQILLILTGHVAVIVALVLLLAMYKYRYKLYIKYVWFARRCAKSDPSKTDLKYDAYVCYCDQNRLWVHDALLPQLENKYGFKLFIRLRDLFGGIYEGMLEAMEQSASIIIVLSKESIQDGNFQFEVEHACRMEADVDLCKTVVVIKLDSIPRSMIQSEYLLKVLDSRHYISRPNYHKRDNNIEGALSTDISEGHSLGVNDGNEILLIDQSGQDNEQQLKRPSSQRPKIDQRPTNQRLVIDQSGQDRTNHGFGEQQQNSSGQLPVIDQSSHNSNSQLPVLILQPGQENDEEFITSKQEAFWAKIAKQLYGDLPLCVINCRQHQEST